MVDMYLSTKFGLLHSFCEKRCYGPTDDGCLHHDSSSSAVQYHKTELKMPFAIHKWILYGGSW